MSGTYKTVFIGDYSVNIWVPEGKTPIENIQNEIEAIKQALTPVIARYGLKITDA